MGAREIDTYLAGGNVAFTGCGSPAATSTAAPVAPFEASRLRRGTYSFDQLEAGLQTAVPTVPTIHGTVFLDNDELVHCLRIDVVDRAAGEAAELALEGWLFPVKRQ